MRYHEIISENVRDAYLYHGTPADSAAKIIYQDTIEGRSPQRLVRSIQSKLRSANVQMASPKYADKFGNLNGVSLSRTTEYPLILAKQGGVVLVLSRERLKQDYKLIPLAYYANRKESEEFVPGPIKNLHKYLVKIIMTKEVFDEMTEVDGYYPKDDDKPYLPVLNFPNLVIL